MLERAGFWRRFFALVVDSLIVGVVLLATAVALFPLTSGRVQSNGLILAPSVCHNVTQVPPGIAVPQSFGANFATDCVASVFGQTVAHSFTIGRSTTTGSATAHYTKTVSVGFMLGDQGQPVRGLSIDLLWLPLFLLVRVPTDLAGGSPGRRLTGMRMADPDGAPATGGRLGRRYAAFALPFLLPALILAFMSFGRISFAFVDSSAFFPTMLGIGLLWLVPMVLAILAIIRRKEAFYDRMVGTMVVLKRSPPPSAEPAPAAV